MLLLLALIIAVAVAALAFIVAMSASDQANLAIELIHEHEEHLIASDMLKDHLRNHVGSRSWPSSDCVECVAADVALP